MSSVFFISDLHFGHKRITKFTHGVPISDDIKRQGDDYLENMHIIIKNWNAVVNKRDLVWVLGDTAFSQEGFDALAELNGRKKLVRGNHDNYFTTEEWLQHFETVEGLTSYKGYWLSHCPIHPDEMRKRKGNIHGHLHHNLIRNNYTNEIDPRYINVCVEHVNHTPLPFDEISSGRHLGRLTEY